MYAVEVRDHIMMAHSLPGEVFGPAQGLHGATYVVDVAFFRETLSADGIVVDIGRAHEALKAALKPLNYANLDDLPQFKGVVTTTEFLCRHIFDQIVAAAHAGALGPGSEGLQKVRVTLNESHVARAWYEGAV
ncbi:MAG TPA: 6-carboxytetrahydropterin synthase [Thermohalobaculum sp.]|nr:6-carboxytetrahydropterin synthase [Thermohalobaculum sp.]